MFLLKKNMEQELLAFRLLENRSVTIDNNYLRSFLRFLNDIKDNEITFIESICSRNDFKNDPFNIIIINDGEIHTKTRSTRKSSMYINIHTSEDFVPHKLEFVFSFFNTYKEQSEVYTYSFPLRYIQGILYIDGISRVKISDVEKERMYCSYYHRNKIIVDDECFYDEGLDIYEQNSYYFPNLI